MESNSLHADIQRSVRLLVFDTSFFKPVLMK
jgi:hypothetical protein